MKLKKIKYDKELSEFDVREWGEVIPTTLTLDDYDWMHYEFKAILPTKKQGLLKISIDYFGTTQSNMYVRQIFDDGRVFKYTYEFDTDIFIRFLKSYMKKHIKQWETKYAFCWDEGAVAIFNRILSKHTSCTIEQETEGETENEISETGI